MTKHRRTTIALFTFITVFLIASLSLQSVFAAAPSLRLPSTSVTGTYGNWLAGASSTLDVTLSNVGTGFDVSDGTYPGWCIQDFVTGLLNGDSVMLYSSYDPNMPNDVKPLPWNEINYVINHQQGTSDDVQIAIWYLVGDPQPSSLGPVTTAAQAMIDAANANPTYEPSFGDLIAVIVYSDGMGTAPNSKQETIIEVPVPAAASVSDFIWNDANGNGIQDNGELGIPDVPVSLYTGAGTLVGSTTSDANGIYIFNNLFTGDYYLIFGRPATFNFTPANQGSNPAVDSDPDPITGQTSTFTLSPGENNDTLDAGLAQMDFGDLPAAYANTLLANDGPRHVIGNLILGQGISPDSDGQESPTASGDTFDDGVVLDPASVWQPSNTVNLTVTVTGGSGYLAGWFDWNNNHTFDAGEMSVGQAVSVGENTISLVVPGDYVTGQNLFARFRLYESEPTTPSSTGMVVNGEDEDYMFSFQPTAIQLSSFSAKPVASSAGVIFLALLGFLSLTGTAWIVRKRHV